jgi:hypothetical protein
MYLLAAYLFCLGLADLPGGAITAMEEEARKMGAKVSLHFVVFDLPSHYPPGQIVLQVRGGAESAGRAFGKHLPEATRLELCKQLEAESGDLIFIAASTRAQTANWALGKVRVASAGMTVGISARRLLTCRSSSLGAARQAVASQGHVPIPLGSGLPVVRCRYDS